MSEEIELQDGFKVVALSNTTDEPINYLKDVDSSFIQLHLKRICRFR